ncbi:MAG: glycerophosphodiester phosphodiesterase family protein [Pseudomonadota bacterium]
MTDIASHRGGAALWPENSEIAFRETVKLGVEQIEFDVQLSADGVPVIFHDATLDRVTDGTGPLAAQTLAELKALNIFRGGGRIMTLDEGLEILAPSHLILRCEIKPSGDLIPYPGIVDKVLAAVIRHGLVDRTVLTSFHLPTLRAVLDRVAPLSDVIWLVSDQIARLTSPAHVATLAAAEGVGAVSLHHRILDGEALATLRGAGLRVGAFGVLEDAAIAKVLQQGVTVFTTDRPDAALRLRAALGA